VDPAFAAPRGAISCAARLPPEFLGPARQPKAMSAKSPTFLGIFEGHSDPAVAVVRDGKVLAYSEEERHLRYKHAHGLYPNRALKYCLDVAGVKLEEIAAVGVNWNMAAYGDGRMRKFYDQVNAEFPMVDDKTKGWQNAMLRRFNADFMKSHHESAWRRLFGDVAFPKLHGVAHHYTHALHACFQSRFDRSICITVDGSGDEHCTVVWVHEGDKITPLREIKIPHSLGWVYAAFTEYLGFKAYDGEYKVMGLAAFGRPNAELRAKVDRIVMPAADGVGYVVDPTYVHYGTHQYSDRYTDKLIELIGRKPRLDHEEITKWHEDLAFAVQENLEDSVERLVKWAVKETGIKKVCISGGVGLNIKMNSRIFQLPEVEDVYANPLCSDGGAAVGAALAACFEQTGARPEPCTHLALGFEEKNEDIEKMLKLAHLEYERPADLAEAVAAELANGRIVGWFQGRMEAGPRALGHRSILADPRKVENRDKVNAIIKFREYWRPFCPSMLKEAADRYFAEWTDAPFMILSFPANDKLKADAPAIVHVDGTSRVQLVDKAVSPRYHALIAAFEKKTGVPVLLNTSYNVKGEPIVCTAQDALRTFWATGLEILAVGDFLVRKPKLS